MRSGCPKLFDNSVMLCTNMQKYVGCRSTRHLEISKSDAAKNNHNHNFSDDMIEVRNNL